MGQYPSQTQSNFNRYNKLLAEKNERHQKAKWDVLLDLAPVLISRRGTLWVDYPGAVAWQLYMVGAPCICFTGNGDNIIESLILLVIFGIAFLLIGRSQKIVGIIGFETMVGSYLALGVSKLGFAMAKSGIFGNKSFS